MSASLLGITPAQELVREHENRTDELRRIFVALIPLATIAVLLRLCSRRIARIRLWWDDYMTVASLIFAVGLNAAFLLGTYHGLGKHAEFVGMTGMEYNLKIEYAAELIYVTSMSCAKIAILLFYYRIFNPSHQRFHVAVWVMGAVILCWYLTSVFVICFQCYPARYMWDRTIPGGQCIPQTALWIGSSVSSLITDVAILCLPMPIIWYMRVTWQQKFALSAVFLLGIFVCVTSVLRLTTIHQISILDGTYTDVDSAIWTSVECSVACISACLPTMKPLFRGFFQSHRPHRNRSNSHTFDRLMYRQNSEESGVTDGTTDTHAAAQWRSAANEKRIRELDIAKFRQSKHYNDQDVRWKKRDDWGAPTKNGQRPADVVIVSKTPRRYGSYMV